MNTHKRNKLASNHGTLGEKIAQSIYGWVIDRTNILDVADKKTEIKSCQFSYNKRFGRVTIEKEQWKRLNRILLVVLDYGVFVIKKSNIPENIIGKRQISWRKLAKYGKCVKRFR